MARTMRQKLILSCIVNLMAALLLGCHKAEKPPAILPEESGDDWQLVWSDEFGGAAIDSTKWEFQIGDGSGYSLPPGWGNDELQWYTDKNAIVENGHLVLTAKTETA